MALTGGRMVPFSSPSHSPFLSLREQFRQNIRMSECQDGGKRRDTKEVG